MGVRLQGTTNVNIDEQKKKKKIRHIEAISQYISDACTVLLIKNTSVLDFCDSK